MLDNILANFLGGLGAAVFITLATLAFSYMRIELLKKSLQKSIEGHGILFGEKGFGITLHNKTPLYIIIRGVHFITPAGFLILNYSGPDTSRIGWRLNSWERDNDYEEIPSFLRFSATIDSTSTERKFVVLPSYTAGQWTTPGSALDALSDKILGCRILVEYPTLFGGRDVIVIESVVPGERFTEHASSFKTWHTGK